MLMTADRGPAVQAGTMPLTAYSGPVFRRVAERAADNFGQQDARAYDRPLLV